MASIENILSGKTSNYFKLDDDELKDGFVIIESIDPAKTDIRSEKTPNKNKKEGEQDTLEYYHVEVAVGDTIKDLSLTFTALKQLAQVLPRNENWKGYKIQYTGKKGSGKNVKYNFSVLGKSDVPEQARLPGDNAANNPVLLGILKSLKDGERFFSGGVIPKVNVEQAITAAGFAGTAVEETIKAFKAKGAIIEVSIGFYKVV